MSGLIDNKLGAGAVGANIKTKFNALIDALIAGLDIVGNAITFVAFPVTPSSAPDANYEVANKKYVDDLVFQHMIVEDQKTAATDGGAFTQDAWRTRVLNTVQVNTITGASLASNQITLPAGTYLIEASAPARNVLRHKTKLRNITDGSDDSAGTNEYSAGGATTRSFITKRITITGAKVFEIQHYCEQTETTSIGSGFGLGTGWAPEVYTQVKITKIG